MTTSEPPGDALAQARERTSAASSARIELSIEHIWQIPPRPHRRRGGLLQPARDAGAAAGRRLLKAATGSADLRHQSAEGVLDVRGRRYMLDYGSYARLYADDQEWDGRSGRELRTLPPDRHALPTPLWLLDVLAGMVEASDEGTDDVRGTTCRRLAVTVDVSRASRATPGGVAVPAVGRFENLLALSLLAWIDDAHIRRLHIGFGHRTETLELWDFGVSLDHLDWGRLPTFRSPSEAAQVAGGRTPAWKRGIHLVTKRRAT